MLHSCLDLLDILKCVLHALVKGLSLPRQIRTETYLLSVNTVMINLFVCFLNIFHEKSHISQSVRNSVSAKLWMVNDRQDSNDKAA